jgi:2-oxoglutarate dehydrogenase E1 component
MAHVNPISTHEIEEPPQLKLETYGLKGEDLSKVYSTFGSMAESTAPLLKIIQNLKAIYCDKIGIEYMGLQNPEMEKWLQQKIEPNLFKPQFSIEKKQWIFQQLNKSELLESFLHTKYVGQKRFSLEGGETLIPMMLSIIDTGADLGLGEFVIGMAHRGRLNVLANILNKSYREIFSEFDESLATEAEGSGDVKYHKGFYAEIENTHGKKVIIDLPPNPSHLEAVDPVVEGMTKAKQILANDEVIQEKIMALLIHGDAAIAGQGIVYETIQFFNLEGYSTGGTIHLIVNNQIGFTTFPKDARSTRYCSDIAKAFGSPVFHINAEDPEGCVYVAQIAIELRQKFHCDVFLDLNCYRKYGHNETDEPAFTQPLEYKIIRKKKTVREIYRDELVHQGHVEKYMAEAVETEFKKALNQALKTTQAIGKEAVSSTPEPKEKENQFQPIETAVPKEDLQMAAERFCTIPEGFNIHPKLGHLVKERLLMVQEGAHAKPIDWGMAETLAYATLLMEGFSVRLSGQDSCRGTFSHRHALWMDQAEEKGYIPLRHIREGQGRFDIYNSPLSEYGVLGFEFGYSEADPSTLVIWEAQFGDFANGAQVVIDQFIAPGEQKWGIHAGLVLFLPHGYEGQGPEHSSARIERFLSLAGHSNLRIANPTTPAQFFHLLRKQQLNPAKKPLIIFTPKGLLRHPACISQLSDLTSGGFKEMLDDPIPPAHAKKIILCSGRIYYDIFEERSKLHVNDVALLRIEQLYPLHEEKLKDLIEKYEGFREIIWAQEEPANMGAWEYIRPHLQNLLPKGKEIKYVGRSRSASTAVGSHILHKKELEAIMKVLFSQYEMRMPPHEIRIQS